MADVIRNVVVRVKLEQVKADLQAPDTSVIKQELEGVQQRFDRLGDTSKRVNDDIQNSVNKSGESFQAFREETNRLGEGFSKLASAGGLYAVAMDDALPPSIRLFSAIRGGVEQMSGLTAVFSQLGGVLAGPVGIAIAAVTTALTIGIGVWQGYRNQLKQADEDAKRARQSLLDYRRGLRTGFADVSADLEIPTDDSFRRESIRQRGSAERLERQLNRTPAGFEADAVIGRGSAILERLGAAREAEQSRLRLAEQVRREAELLNAEKQAEIESANRLLEVSRAQLDLEEKKRQSTEARLGALSRGEQQQLRNLAERFGNGDNLSRGQLNRLQQLGGSLAADKVQAEFANRGRDLADEIAKALGVDRNAGVNAAQQRANQAANQLAELTNGQTFEAAIKNLETQRAAAVGEAQKTIDSIEGVLQEITAAVDRVSERVRLSEYAAGN